MTTPLCFILMPFGRKPAGSGRHVDFDAVYEQIIAPAVREAGMEPLRADGEKQGGIIHKAMFERLILCDYAVADLTTANANVFYELGVRHAVRPAATALIFAEGLGQLPFDVNGLRGLPYQLGADGRPSHPEHDQAALAERLRCCRNDSDGPATDSPLYQLVEGFPDIQHLKTDVFRQRVRYAADLKERLAAARHQIENDPEAALQALTTLQQELPPLHEAEPAVLIDLLLSYRAAEAWPQMIALVETMPELLQQTVLVREQYALALNRAGNDDRAETVIRELITEKGPSSESYGILGRIYKDRWEKARNAGKSLLAQGHLKQAIDTYLKGFESDWRDAYPGINALTLMEMSEPPDPRREQLNPVVRYAVERRIAAGHPDYWDFATLLELAALADDQTAAEDALEHALVRVREPWEKESTARNLSLIRDNRQQRGANVALLNTLIAALRD
ncbi:MAG: DUF4071 domain-containing protein [Desulfuromonas sp.]|nr:MAG: DUF4071 domain-containing protein [Desulfuromonas sp.]